MLRLVRGLGVEGFGFRKLGLGLQAIGFGVEGLGVQRVGAYQLRLWWCNARSDFILRLWGLQALKQCG